MFWRRCRRSSSATRPSRQHVLALPTLPRRIECFDISTIQGSETVASMVVCEDGRMRKAEYRKFRIRGIARPSTGSGRAEASARSERAKTEQPLVVSLSNHEPPAPPPPLVRDPSSYGGPVRPASAKATAVRRSFSEGGSAEGAKAGSPQVPTNSYGTGRLCCR
ncbi:MAG: hypothetical protein DMF96_14340 [Acidobacteria bacterium]|nr:MAG: hypothetical protein DMF96_14340 [Acidobacteriota bacterium]